MKVIRKNNIDDLIKSLIEHGYTVIGPTVKDGAIIYDEIESTNDLPIGYGDEQKAGYYRLKKRNDNALFGYVVGPHSWKKYLFPQKIKLWSATKNGKGFTINEEEPQIPKYAFIGVRACEIKAILIQDKVFNNNLFSDKIYNTLRKNILILAVNCTVAANTCFCVSMKTGPKALDGYDISITEIINNNDHYFLLDIKSDAGNEITSKLQFENADEKQINIAELAIKDTEKSITRKLNTEGIKELLYSNHDHPNWQEIASRCLTCANCTMVCPTCFCSNVEDTTDLTGNHTERWRKWDSCFNLDYSKVAGGNFRTSPKARYRQWMTHKLASWIDQFGTSGCVGCGRCITWCPVGIDITKEAERIRNSPNTVK